MATTTHTRVKKAQRGQTIILVAIALASLVAMAALAIDVVTLYSARSEAQNAADAAALAGAKSFVDTGVTTDPTNLTLKTLAQATATTIIGQTVSQNTVFGVHPQLVGAPTFNLTADGDPQVTVTVQRTDLPVFFARIWGRSSNTVTATATAEAYNSAYSNQVTSGPTLPAAPKCVKPMLVPNLDPGGSGKPFINVNTGAVDTTVLSVNRPITLTLGCSPGNCFKVAINPSQYYPAITSINPKSICPSSGSSTCSGATAYSQSVQCCDGAVYACGGGVSNASIDITNTGWGAETSNALQCLTHAPGSDTLDTSNFPSGPMAIKAGDQSPLIGAGSPVNPGDVISTSDSIVAVPVFDNTTANTTTGQVTVIGFLQIFVTSVDAAGKVTGTVLNISGCGANVATTIGVSGGGVSPVPVRLIHQ